MTKVIGTTTTLTGATWPEVPMMTTQDSCEEAPCSCFVMRTMMDQMTIPAVVPAALPLQGPAMPGRVAKARSDVVGGGIPPAVMPQPHLQLQRRWQTLVDDWDER